MFNNRPSMASRGAIAAACLFILCSTIQVVHSADIVHEIRNPNSTGGPGGFVELGIGLEMSRVPLLGFSDRELDDTRDASGGLFLHLDGRLEWKRLFIEAINDSFNTVTLGFTAHQTERNTVELVLTSQYGDFYPSDYEGFSTVEDRASDLSLGFRSLHQFDNRFIQVEAGRDVSDSHNGFMAAVLGGRTWQVRNWNMHAMAGIRYASSNVLNHYFGIRESESTTGLAAYRAGAGTLLSMEFGAVKPLNEKWLLRTKLSFDRLPDAVTESPFATGRAAWASSIRVIRVF